MALSKNGMAGEVSADAIDEMASELADCDLIGFSSMTGYSKLTHAVIRRVRELSKRPYVSVE